MLLEHVCGLLFLLHLCLEFPPCFLSRLLLFLSFEGFLPLLLHHVRFVLLFQLSLNVLEGLLHFSTDLIVRALQQVYKTKEVSIFGPNEFDHFALGERGNEMAVDSMTVKHSKDLDFTINENEHVVLILLVDLSLLAREFDVLVEERILALSVEMSIHILLLKQSLIVEETKFFLITCVTIAVNGTYILFFAQAFRIVEPSDYYHVVFWWDFA